MKDPKIKCTTKPEDILEYSEKTRISHDDKIDQHLLPKLSQTLDTFHNHNKELTK